MNRALILTVLTLAPDALARGTGGRPSIYGVFIVAAIVWSVAEWVLTRWLRLVGKVFGTTYTESDVPRGLAILVFTGMVWFFPGIYIAVKFGAVAFAAYLLVAFTICASSWR
jgi:hypothetical protein